MTIDASDFAIRVLRGPPAASFGAIVLFVAAEAGFRAGRGIARFETEDQPRFPALRLQVAAGRPVAAFARVAAMHVFGEYFRVGPVAIRAQLIVVDVFGVGDRGYLARDLLIGNLGEEIVPPRITGIEVGFGTARRHTGRLTGYRHHQQRAYAQNRQERGPGSGRLAFSSAHSFTS